MDYRIWPRIRTGVLMFIRDALATATGMVLFVLILWGITHVV
jgi:hypothetical protein